jgi:hypothetical protein
MHFVARRQWRSMRIGDAERDRALAALKRHYQEGRLTFEEFDERTDAATVARTNGDLERVQRELPALVEPASLDRQIRLYLIVNAFLVLIWAGNGGGDGFWPLWPILVWGFLLVLRGSRRQPRGRALPRGR